MGLLDSLPDEQPKGLLDSLPEVAASHPEMLASHSRPWSNSGDRQAVQGIASPSGRAQAAQAKKPFVAFAESVPVGAAKIADTAAALVGSFAEKPETSLASKVQRNITEPAIKYWESRKTPEPLPTVGQQVAGSLGELAPTIMLGPGALPTMAATATYQTGKDLLEADIPLEAAQTASLIQGAGAAAMGAIPGAAPTLGKSALLALTNPVTGIAQRAATREYLRPYNEKVAEGFDPVDPAALVMDVAMAIPGMAQHPRLKKMQAIKDADLLSRPAEPVMEQTRQPEQPQADTTQRDAAQEETVRQHNQEAGQREQQKTAGIAEAQKAEQEAAKYVGSRVEQTFETPQGKETIRWRPGKEGGIEVTTTSPTANGRSKSVDVMSMPELADYLKSKDVVLREQFNQAKGATDEPNAQTETMVQPAMQTDGTAVPVAEGDGVSGKPKIEPSALTSFPEMPEAEAGGLSLNGFALHEQKSLEAAGAVYTNPDGHRVVNSAMLWEARTELQKLPVKEQNRLVEESKQKMFEPVEQPEVEQLKARLLKLQELPEPKLTDKTIVINGQEINLRDVNIGKRNQKITDLATKIAEMEKANGNQGREPAEVVGAIRDGQEPGGAVPNEAGSGVPAETGGQARRGVPASDEAPPSVETGIAKETSAAETTAEVARDKWEAAHQEVDRIHPTIKDMKQVEPHHIVMDIQTMHGGQPGKKISAPYDGTEADALRVAKALKLYAAEELNASMRDSAVFATGENSQPKYAFTQGEGVTEIHPVSNNASGQTDVSLEATSEMKSRQKQGIKTVIIDTRSMKERPAIGIRPEDNTINPFNVLVRRHADGRQEILKSGDKARPLKETPVTSGPSTSKTKSEDSVMAGIEGKTPGKKGGKAVGTSELMDGFTSEESVQPDIFKEAAKSEPEAAGVPVPFNVQRNFLRGLEEGAQSASLRRGAVPEGEARKMAWTSGAKLQREVKAYEQGYEMGSDPEFVQKWKDNRNLLNHAIQSGKVNPIGWKFVDGWAEETTAPSSSKNSHDDTGGYAERTPPIRETTQTFIELPEMLKIYKAINEGKLPKLVEALGKALGRFTHRSDGTSDISLRKDLFAGPELAREKVKSPMSKTAWEAWQEAVRKDNPGADIIFRQGKAKGGKMEVVAYKRDPSFVAKIFAHEIGHAVDYLPDHIVKGRGNILGHVAALKRYMEKTLAMYPDAKGQPLTAEDIARFKEAAKADGADIVETVTREVPKYETVGITPEMITEIWNGIGDARTTTPELYKFIANLSDAEKKAVVVQAMKGLVDERLQKFAGKRQVGTETITEEIRRPGGKAAIKKRFNELLQEEINKRRLYERDAIMKELEALTQAWKPFNPQANTPYTKYRHSPAELYADAVSVLFNEPQLLKDTAPTFYKAFFYYMGERPAFKEAYTSISRLSKDPDLAKTRLQDRFDMYDRGDEKYNENRAAKADKQSVADTFFEVFSDENHHTKQLFDNSPTGEAARNRLEAIAYTPGEVSNYYLDQHALRKENQALGITDNEFGAYMDLMHTIEHRSDIANSLGTTEATAKSELKELKSLLGPEKFAQVEQAAEQFGKIRKGLFKTWLDEGIITQEQHDQFESRSNYVRTEVQHYLDSKYGSGTAASAGWKMLAEGTMSDKVNPYIATVLQDMAIIRMGRVNNAKVAAIDHLAPSGSAPLAKRGAEGRPVEPPEGYANMVVLRNGKPEYRVVSDFIAKTYTHDPVKARQINVVWGAIQSVYKNLFISKNVPWMIRNAFFRDPAATFKNNPEFKVMSIPDRVRIYKELFKAIPEVYRDVVKGERSDELRQMYDDNMLNIERVYSEKDTTWENELDRMAFEFAQGKSPSQSKIMETAKAINQFINHWGSVSDKAPKLAGKRLLEAKGLKGEVLAKRVRNTVGTPDFQVRSGGHNVFNYIGMFYEVRKASYRTMQQAYKADPFQYIAKTITMNILPKLAAAAAVNGLFGDDAKEAYSKIMKWDRALYNTIPLPPRLVQMLRDRGLISEKTGGYFKLPADYEGQVFGAVAQHLIEKDAKGILNDLYTAQPLSGHAFWGNVGNSLLYVTGGMPYDSFRQKPVLTREQQEYTRINGPFNKKGMAGMGAYLYNSTLGAALPKIDNKEFPSTPTAFEKAVGMTPGLSTFIVLSDGAAKAELRDVLQKDRDVKTIQSFERGDRINEAVRQGKTSASERMSLYRQMAKEKLLNPVAYSPGQFMRQFQAAMDQKKYGVKPQSRKERGILRQGDSL